MRRTEKKIKMMRKSLKRDLEKVRRRLRREPYCLPSASIVALFCFVFNFIFLTFVMSNYVSNKI